MFPAHRLACVVLALVSVSVSAQYQYCHVVQTGNINAEPMVLAPVKIGSGIRDSEVDVPPKICGSQNVVGLSVRVCDNDSRPDLYLPNPYVAIVHRNGALTREAPVTMTVYCGYHTRQHTPKVQIRHN